MHNQLRKNGLRKRRALRVRKQVRGTAEKPRLSVYRTNKHISAQLIDDVNGVTIANASTLARELRGTENNSKSMSGARVVGQTVAKAAQEKGIQSVVFDRGFYKYHGLVAALADAAREAGLKF